MTDSTTAVRDPRTGLTFVELSHPWGHGAPAYPGAQDPAIQRRVFHSQHGVLSHTIRTTFHTGTHLNAPLHLVQRAQGIGELPLETFFGPGVVLSVQKEQWGLVTADDLAAAGEVERGDIVLVVTGWHRYYGDSQQYFAHAPGLSPEGAHYLVDRGAKLVGVDTAYVDHPLATALAEHRGGPLAPYLVPRYETQTGLIAKEGFPDLQPAHKVLLGAGIPTIENVGGDVNTLLGRRATIAAMPWRWDGGDASQIRLVGLTDASGALRIETGLPR